MKVLICASECSPLVKVGGIADVIGSFPIAIKNNGVDARVVLPYYKPLEDTINSTNIIKTTKREDFKIEFDHILENVEIYETNIPSSDIPVYLIKNEKYISNGGIYFSPRTMNSPDDELLRFAFFSKAVGEIFGRNNSIFNPNIIHCNDWHTGMVPQVIQNMLRYQSQDVPKTVFTIHNLAYQGFSKVEVAEKVGIDLSKDQTLKWDAQDDNLDFVLQGIVGANYITTVSEKYAKEIQTPDYGEGLHEILAARKDRLSGIINGISYDIFNPSTDNYLFSQYGLSNVSVGKRVNKTELQRELDMNIDESKPLIGIISRLAHQKGLDLVADTVLDILTIGFQIIILGTGDPQLELRFNEFNKNSHINKNYKAIIAFSEETARKIYAGSDMFLISSRYEPCGLTQLISMKYGSVPVVRGTGGLYDTVREGTTGFTFDAFNKSSMMDALKRAYVCYIDNKTKWNELVINGMKQDYSWNESGKLYVNLYQKVLSS